MKHDWENKIVGYLPQSEPRWVTSFGYRPPIMEYTCKACDRKITGRGGSMLFVPGYGLLAEDCPGVKP